MSSNVEIVFGAGLKAARKAKGLMQEDLAHELGVRFGSVNRWENGKSFPRPEQLDKIAQFFGVPIHRFFHPDGLSACYEILAAA